MALPHVALARSAVTWAGDQFIARDLERAMRRRGRPVRVRVLPDETLWPNDFVMERDGLYTISYPTSAPRHFVLATRHFLRAYLYWMDLTSTAVRRISVNGSDGHQPSRAVFAASAAPARHVVIPDPHFFVRTGFQRERLTAADASAWSARSEDVVWRGLGNGAGRLSLAADDQDDQTVIPRLRMCMKFNGVPRSDVQLSGILGENGIWAEAARQQGLLADDLPADTWLRRKYAIDIDGVTNTWSNLLVRMLFGCCVLKVESQLGFRQWYYDRLRPFEHYVPVRADMSDFFDRIEWVRTHDAEARDIAAAGQRFAMGLDFEAGKRDAVEIITANWNRDAG